MFTALTARRYLGTALALVLMGLPAAMARAQGPKEPTELPADAQQIVKKYQEDTEAAKTAAEAARKDAEKKHLGTLESMRDAYAEAGKTKEVLAIGAYLEDHRVSDDLPADAVSCIKARDTKIKEIELKAGKALEATEDKHISELKKLQSDRAKKKNYDDVKAIEKYVGPWNERDKFQGTWQLAVRTENGDAKPVDWIEYQPIPYNFPKTREIHHPHQVEIERNRMYAAIPTGFAPDYLSVFFAFTVTDATSTPHRIDLTSLSEGKTCKGIYVFDGKDTVKICWNEPGKGRPTTFESQPGSKATLMVFRRIATPD